MDRYTEFCNEPKLPTIQQTKLFNMIRDGDMNEMQNLIKKNK